MSNTALLLIHFYFVSSLRAFPLPLNCTEEPTSALCSCSLPVALTCQADPIAEIWFSLRLGRAAFSPASARLGGAGATGLSPSRAFPVGGECPRTPAALPLQHSLPAESGAATQGGKCFLAVPGLNNIVNH